MSDPSISWLSTVASERKRTIIQTIPASHLQSVQIHQLRCGFITLIIELTEIKVESLNALWRVGPVCSQQAMIRIYSFSLLCSVFSLFSRLQLINPGSRLVTLYLFLPGCRASCCPRNSRDDLKLNQVFSVILVKCQEETPRPFPQVSAKKSTSEKHFRFVILTLLTYSNDAGATRRCSEIRSTSSY